jgi:DNA-binding CsgD family transcriptional regulator
MKTINLNNPAFPLSDPLKDLFLLWQSQPFIKDNWLIDYKNLVAANPCMSQVLGFNPCITWVLDVCTQQFIFFSNNTQLLIGYPASTFKKDGFRVLHRLMHPDDKKNMGEMTYELWKRILLLPADKRQGYRFSRKYRLQKSDGNFICILEQNAILQTDSKGNITHLLGTCTDITEVVNVNNLVASVQVAPGQVEPQIAPGEERFRSKTKLSKREKQIVKLVAEGYSSKLIADQLFISFHTVNTHRKNIICKTHSKNTSGLVQYAISNRII